MEDDTARAIIASADQQIIVKACDMCRKKKIRCEPKAQGCTQCTKSGTRCHFTPISTRRTSRRPAGYKHISKLEERLKKLEGLLQHTLKKNDPPKAGPPQQEHSSFGVLKFGPREKPEGQLHLPPLPSLETPQTKQPADPQAERTDRQTRLSHVVQDPCLMEATGSQPWQQSNVIRYNYVENDSNLPDLTSHNKTSGQGVLADKPLKPPMQPSLSWKGTLALGPFSLPSFHELPTKSVALQLVQDTFQSFNRFFPIFDEQEFLHQFHHQYTESSPSNPAWWACINVVLSLAHRFRAMRTLQTAYENSQSCGYIHNALAVVSEISILRHSLPAIQALVGMAIILQGSPNPQVSSVLTAAAVRLAQAMGLHRRTQDQCLSARQIEQRKRVFWAAYFLDKDISLRMGQPFAQDDDDMDAELPSESPTDLPLIGVGDGCRKINFFNARIGLAVIQGQVYKRLYSVQAARQSEAQKAAVAHELGSVLSYWRSSVPVDFEDEAVVPLQPPLSVEFIHMLILRFTYVNCLVMIDRHLPPPDFQTPDAVFAEVSMLPESLCIIESRKAIRLIQVTPPGDYACVWILLHPFFAAVEVLLHNVILHPASPHATSDLHIVEPFLGLLEILAGDKRQCSRSEEAEKMYRLCNELINRARKAVSCSSMSLTLGLMSDLGQ